MNDFQKDHSSSVIRSYNLCFLLTVGRPSTVCTAKKPSPKRPEVCRIITQSPSEWMLVHSVYSFPGILLFQVTHVKSVSYFRLAQVLNFTKFINTVQSLSYCCDDSLVSRGRGGKKHLKHIFTRSFQSSFLLFSSLLPNEKRPVLCDLISSTK